jgi:hypothetical protein
MLSGQERFFRPEGSSQTVTWVEFRVNMGNYLQYLLNSPFEQINDTCARVAEQLSVYNDFHAQTGLYMMEEMMKLVQCVEELEAPANTVEQMEIFIEDIPLIQPAPH